MSKNETRNACAFVTIIDYQVVENMETFRITIISSGEIVPPSNVGLMEQLTLPS